MTGTSGTADIKAEAITAVVGIRLELTPEQANDVYTDIYCLLRDQGISSPYDRFRLPKPGLYALYDALYAAGIDGSGPHSPQEDRP